MEWTNEKPWHGIGVEIETNLSPREMMTRLDLDQQLSKNKRLKSMANDKAVRYFKTVTDMGNARIEAFGKLESEPILWMLASLDEEFTLNGGDTVRSCLLLSSKNEKRERVQIQFATVRVGCNNTFMVPIKERTAFSNVLLTLSKFDNELIQKIKDTLALGQEAVSIFASDAQRMADCKVDDQIANRFMFDVFQPDISKELTSIGEAEIAEKADDKTKKAIEAMTKAPGQDMESTQMTVWGLLNAVTYTVDHLLGKSQDFRLRQAWFGFNTRFKKRAFDLAMELSK